MCPAGRIKEDRTQARTSLFSRETTASESMDETSTRFEAHVGPVREALVGLLDEAESLRQRWGSLPDAHSQAMAEVAAESEYRGESPWGDDPVQQAHNLGQLLLVGADDLARSTCKLLQQGDAPVFAHVVLARSALEHAARAWRLLDPTVRVRQRIARGMNERLFSLSQQAMLPSDPEVKRRARDRIRSILGEAERVGLRRLPSRPRIPAYLEEARPSSTELVRRLLESGSDRELGKLIYAYFSAVTHGTAFGLSQSVDRDMATASGRLGATQGAVYTSSQGVCTVLTGLVLGFAKAMDARNELFLWDSAAWKVAVVSALRAGRTSLGITY
jgi:hypothetical protein